VCESARPTNLEKAKRYEKEENEAHTVKVPPFGKNRAKETPPAPELVRKKTYWYIKGGRAEAHRHTSKTSRGHYKKGGS